MVDYVKRSSGTSLSTATSWLVGGSVASTVPNSATNDTTTWETTSLGPGLTGNFSTRKITVNGASGNIAHAGNITLGVDGFLFAEANTRQWYQTGIITVSGAQTWALSNSAQGFWLASAGSLAGSSNITLTNNSGTTIGSNAYIVLNGAFASYSGTLIFKDYTRCIGGSGATAGALTNGNIIIDGVGCDISVQPGLSALGSSSRAITFNFNAALGSALATLPIAMNVTLAGTGTRELTITGNVDVNGTVSGTNGVSINVTDTTVNSRIRFSGASNGLSGPCTVGGNRAAFVGATTSVRYAPSSLTINTGGEFNYVNVTQDFTFPVAPTGVGAISIVGSFAGNGCTFSAGLLDSYSGRLVAWPGTTTSSDNLVKLIIHQVPVGGLEWRGNAAASNSMVGRITYANAANLVTSAPLLLDTYVNTTPASLTGGEFSLIVPSTSGTFQCSGAVTRENSIGTASARMSLTLGGSNTGDNTLSGDISEVGTNGAILGITKVDAGRWVLSGANSSHTGIHTISAGTLSAQSATALGSATSTGGVFISGSGALELAGGITLNKSVTDFTVSNATNPIQSIGTNELLTKQLTLSTTPTLTITSGNKLTLSPQGAGVIAGANGITKAGDGELELTAKANTFSGTLTVSAGTLTVASVANSGVAAAWGQASSAVLVSGALKYTGGAASTTRGVQMTGAAPTINASGTGALVLNSVTQDTNAKTMTLRGTNTDANTISSLIANNSGAVSLAKEDAGKWVLNGGLAHTGTTAVNGGTLRIEVGNNNTASGAVTIGASGTVELITDTLASSGASAGEVLGTGNVTVNGGTIKTRGGVTQKGQVRYGGNLTFGTGSKLYIGAAA